MTLPVASDSSEFYALSTVVNLSTMKKNSLLKNDPLWFKDAIIYEVPIRAFADSNGDGIGDLKGLTKKLDYLQDLGVTAIWTLPFFPSPLKDDGYDIADYYSINPIYGTLEDFQELLEEAHKRGIRVIIELIVNHTSDQHPWFQRARRAPKGSEERDFYVWSDTPDKYPEVRIIFQDFETSNWAWDPLAKAYYWHRFYSHQPDLNYENPAVQQAVLDIVDFWLEMGVDGLRMDAVPYLCVQEGTSCENLPQTHVFLQRLRAHVDEKFPNRMLLAEANQWPEDAAAYYGTGNECHMNFHFPLMPRLFMSIQMEDSFPIIDILQQTPHIPDNCQWALFLRNHDELTLEMVSDEDRDYMYRVYAQDRQARLNLGIRRRLAPLMGNNRRRIELMNSLLLSLPGTPVLYYGDEIGMGDNIYLGDRNGVRTPMQWSADRNAGFSRTNPQKLYAPPIVDPEYHYEAVNVEAQRENPNSLWWWVKRLIAIRERFQAFGRGTFEFLYPENRKVLAFTRTYAGEHILVLANLSRFVQTVELDLSGFQGMTPVEIFGRTEFPPIGESNYFISIGPHAFYWFTLQVKEQLTFQPRPLAELPTLEVLTGPWPSAFYQNEPKTTLESILPDYFHARRWFGGKARIIQSTQITEVIPVPYNNTEAQILLVTVNYTEGVPEIYCLPLAFDPLDATSPHYPEHGVAKVWVQEESQAGVLVDAFTDKAFLMFPLIGLQHRSQYQGMLGKLIAEPMNGLITETDSSAEPHLLRGEQSNTSVVYGDSLILKFFRKVEMGVNPDLEVGQFITRKVAEGKSTLDEHFAPVKGALTYKQENGGEIINLGILLKFIPETRDAWSYTLDNVRNYFERVMVTPVEISTIEFPPLSLALQIAFTNGEAIEEEVGESLPEEHQDIESPEMASTILLPEFAYEIMGPYLNSVQLLGQRTAELHITLASDLEDPDFAPEAFTSFYQRSIYQYTRNLAGQVLLLLKKRLPQLEPDLQQVAQIIINRKEQLMSRLASVMNPKITAMRTRCHGDYHLGQVLYTGKDFIIIDFEGEPARALSERRMKRSPLRDVAGMLQSFNYAASMGLRNELESGMIRDDQIEVMSQWGQFWYRWVSVSFLQSYLTTAKDSGFLPQTEQEMEVLLDAYLLEKAIYELGYELNNRPTWADIPLQRILQLLESPEIKG